MTISDQIGNDVQVLTDRLAQVENYIKDCDSAPEKTCAGLKITNFNLTDQGEIKGKNGQLLRYKTGTTPSERAGDCEWKKETITIYSNGNYVDIYELKDHGTYFGDCFATQIKLHNAAGSTLHEWKWDVKVAPGAIWTDTITGNSSAIKAAFDEIVDFSREGVCTWPC